MYSEYRSNARNYHNGPYTSISTFSCNQLCTLFIRGLSEKLEKVCNELCIDQDSFLAREDTTADPHDVKVCVPEEKRRKCMKCHAKTAEKPKLGKQSGH